MSTFKEICAAFKDGRNNYIAYRDECHWAAARLAVSLQDVLGIPSEEIKFFPLHEDPKTNTTYTSAGAMNLEQDGLWHFGISFLVYEAQNVFPQERVGLHVKLKKTGDKFVFVIEGMDQQFEISDLSGFTGFKPICESICQHLVNSYRSDLRKFLEGTETRKIGFAQS